MISFLKKYKAFLYGLVIMIALLIFLQWIDFIRIDRRQVGANLFFFLFWWFTISLPIYKIELLKKKKKTIYKILGLLAVFVVIIMIDSTIGVPDSPITIPLIVVFGLGVVYVMFAEFFKKYQQYIIGVYLLALGYFLYVRIFSRDLATYMQYEKETALIFLVLPIPFLLLLWTYEQWKWLKALKAEKAKAELALLKSQINPHFFFNTLNNLHALTVKNSAKASDVILKLSDMMRYTIYEGKKETVPLKEEIDYLRNYIELNEIRHHRKVSVDFSEDVNGNPEISPLLFIILLENAFKHGVETLTEKAYIKMDLIAENDRVEFNIENNFDSEELSGKEGIGIKNLKRRLELIYPGKHQFVISENGNTFKVQLIVETA